MVDAELPPPEGNDAIADALGLFGDAPSSPRSAPVTEAAPTGESYDLDASVEAPSERAPVPRIVSHPVDAAIPEKRSSPRESRPVGPPATVSEVWSRGAEWRGTFITLAIAAMVVCGLAYLLFNVEEWMLALLVLMAGGLGMLLLSYPILITLERPVRITPEQAVRDYFGALSHHRPHFKRMWLLLSDRGKYGGSFATFDGFRRYWTNRLSDLQRGHASALTPLKFAIAEFKSEKSAGRTEISGTYVVEVYVRGRQAEGVVERFEITSDFVKGPDGMWYLNRATLP